MKTKLLTVTILMLLLGELSAQTRNPRISKEEIINRKWTYIQEKSALSAADVVKVEPIFRETEMELWELIGKNREVFKNNRRRSPQTAINYEAINEAVVNFEVENAQIQYKYYLKLKKILPAQTINRLLTAERAYKRELMQRAPGKQRGQKPQE
ncbi:MAG: hypothetical protein PHQ11_05260 [Paludibacter sp.]|nr:hypothetical protein [Paludibacter sp.]MDD4199686.1 hypothetical protein [Paludibacter sp.]MDD4428705.1 hypothetical protein [Paludibacter sp.]